MTVLPLIGTPLLDQFLQEPEFGVALAELLGVQLLTLDRRIGRAPGLRCSVATP